MLGWEPPEGKGRSEQPRWKDCKIDLDEVLGEPTVLAVLDRWWTARLHEAPAFSGGVLDAWPALMVDGFALCRIEEQAIDDFVRWQEARANG